MLCRAHMPSAAHIGHSGNFSWPLQCCGRGPSIQGLGTLRRAPAIEGDRLATAGAPFQNRVPHMTLCSNDELAMAKLADRPLQQRDFRDLEAREALGDAGHACEHRLVIGSSTMLDEGVNTPRRTAIMMVSGGRACVATGEARDCVSDRQLAAVVDCTRADQESDAGGGEEHHRQEI
jgi:hypothetical protein